MLYGEVSLSGTTCVDVSSRSFVGGGGDVHLLGRRVSGTLPEPKGFAVCAVEPFIFVDIKKPPAMPGEEKPALASSKNLPS